MWRTPVINPYVNPVIIGAGTPWIREQRFSDGVVYVAHVTLTSHATGTPLVGGVDIRTPGTGWTPGTG